MFGAWYMVAVHFIVMYVYCACVCHIMHGMSINTAPLYHLSLLLHVHVHCMLQLVSCSHLFPAFLDPLVDSLVACQRLTSLELRSVTLSLQSFLAVVKGLHNLRALGLESVHFQADLLDEEDKGVSVFEVHLHKLKTIAVFEVFDMSCKSIN